MTICLSPGKLGLNVNLSEACRLAKVGGFDGVEVTLAPDDDPGHVKAILDEHGVVAAGQALSGQWREDEAAHAGLLDQLKTRVPAAVSIGSKCFVTWLASWSDDMSYAANLQWHIDRFKPIANVLSEHGCKLALEFLGPRTLRQGHRYTFIHTLEQILDLCEQIGDNATVLLDSWHWHSSLGTIEDLRALPIERLGYVHVNDAPEGVPIEQLIDQDRRLPAATGVIDIGGFLGAIKEIGYDGTIVPEPFDSSLAGQEPETVIERASDSIQKMLAAKPHPVIPTTMNAVGMGDSKATLIQLPTPRPQGNQVLVKLHASMICGSNLSSFHRPGGCSISGHEACGEVVAVAHSTRLKVGDRVALNPLNGCGNCRYCRTGNVIVCSNKSPFEGHFAQYSSVSDIMCTLIPDDISYEEGALLGCGLGPAYGGLKYVGARSFDTVVITGLGPVGLGATALATFMNARVIGIDMEPYRLDVAKQLGAAVTLSPAEDDFEDKLREAIGPTGHLKGLDCSGSPIAQRMHIDLAAPLARVAFIGENQNDLPISPSKDLIRKQLKLTGIWHMNVLDQEDLITFLRRAPEKVEKLITHRFSFDQANEAFAIFESKKAVKVVLTPHA